MINLLYSLPWLPTWAIVQQFRNFFFFFFFFLEGGIIGWVVVSGKGWVMPFLKVYINVSMFLILYLVLWVDVKLPNAS